MEQITRRLSEEIIQALDDEDRFYAIIRGLKSSELVSVQHYLWDFTLNLGLELEKPLTRDDMTEKMEDTYSYQMRVGCDEPLDYCRANFCVMSNPNCAGDKILDHIRALREIICQLKKS